jgi:hypothetical protein
VLIWLIARLSTVSSVVVAERRGLGAFGRSWALTRGYALRIVGAGLLLVIVGNVAVLAAQTVFGSIFRIVLGNEGVMNAATVLTALFVAIVSAAFTTVLTTFFAKLYVALAARAKVADPV